MLDGREYALILRNDMYDIHKEDAKLTQYWIRIPVAGKREGIKYPITPLSPQIPYYAKRLKGYASMHIIPYG